MSDDTPEVGTAASTGIADAVSAFKALLDPTPDKRAPRNETPAHDPEAEDDAEAAEQAETEDDASEDSEPASEDDTDTEDDAESDEQEESGPLDPRDTKATVKIKIDGKETVLPLKEIADSYLRQSDYTRKTSALADERKALTTELEAVRIERVQYNTLLSALESQLGQAGEQEPDWDALYQRDRHEWAVQRQIWSERQTKMQAVQAEKTRLADVANREHRTALKQRVETERSKLLESFPEWRTPEKWDGARKAIIEQARSLGFTDAELEGADARAVTSLWKSAQYDKLMAKQPRPQPAAKGAAPSPLTKASSYTPKQSSEANRAQQRLERTGSLQDAAAVFKTFL